MKNFSPHILRTIRKYYGISQVNLAQIIDVRQSTISKLESGTLELSAIQWIELCQKYKVDPNTLYTGKIESLENIDLNIDTNQTPGIFKIPKKYKLFMGSTVRTLYPFIKFMEMKIGEEKTKLFYKEMKIDSDYFNIQNLPINIKVIEDTFSYLTQRGFLNSDNVEDILNTTSASEVHQYTLEKLNPKASPDKNFKDFTNSIGKNYEINSSYRFEGDSKCFIKVRDCMHLKELKLSPSFQKFRELYNIENYNKISPLLFSNRSFRSINRTGGWDLASM